VNWASGSWPNCPPASRSSTTRHYVVCYDTSRDYARWCGALFERLHDVFLNFWSRAGIAVASPTRPLVVVIFSDKAAYEAHAARDLGAAADRVVGYYNLMSNRVTTFDLTETDGPAGSAAGSATAANQIMASPAAAGLVATLVHATYFETPDLASQRGWKGIGNVNKPRLERYLARPGVGSLERMIVDDDMFRDAEGALDAYARAWALTYYLMQTRKEAFVGYMKTIARKEPLAEDSPEQRLRDFEEAFGAAPAAVEETMLRFLSRLRASSR